MEAEGPGAGAGARPPWAEGYVHRTRGEPAVAFVARAEPEDFLVEELPLAEPAGAGGHAWLLVEKRCLTTPEAARRVAAALGRPAGEVRHAGLKDRRAVARQWLSVPSLDPDRARSLEISGVRVLRAEAHGEPARMGRIAGNRFTLRLRGLAPGQRATLERLLERLAREGLANYYGAQRFGRTGRAHELGRLLVERRFAEYLRALVSAEHWPDGPALSELRERLARGTKSALRPLARLAPRLGPVLGPLARELARRRDAGEGALRALPPGLVRLHLSALQSRAFNRVLAARLGGLGIDELLPGDVASAEGREPTGPLPGWRVERASLEPGALEEGICAAEGARPEDFRGIGRGLDRLGARRALRAPVRAPELSWREGVARLAFELPAGSYATVLLEEFEKRLA